jgi:hypothetical protein
MRANFRAADNLLGAQPHRMDRFPSQWPRQFPAEKCALPVTLTVRGRTPIHKIFNIRLMIVVAPVFGSRTTKRTA